MATKILSISEKEKLWVENRKTFPAGSQSMKNPFKWIIVFIIIMIVLMSCAPAPTSAPTPQPTNTSVPMLLLTSTPTNTPIAELQAATISGEKVEPSFNQTSQQWEWVLNGKVERVYNENLHRVMAYSISPENK